MGLFDTVSDVASGIGDFAGGVFDFLGDNQNVLKPISTGVLGFLNLDAQKDAQKKQLEFFQNREVDNFNSQREALLARLAAASGGGHAGAAEPFRHSSGALKQALEAQLAQLQRAEALFNPFLGHAEQLVPAQSKAALDAMALLGNLQNTVGSPEAFEKINRPRTPAFAQKIPVPRG